MTGIAGDIAHHSLRGARADRMLLGAIIAIGSAGAVGATEHADDPALTLTKNGGTGDYTLAFPKAPTGRIVSVYVVSPAGTVKGLGVIAFDPAAGTLNFITHNGAGTAANPASGDKVHAELDLGMKAHS